MNLSDNYTLKEMCKSKTAVRLGIDNFQPSAEEIKNMVLLSNMVLQPTRNHFGRLPISSGFRCLELNRALHSKDESQHPKGEAADIEKEGVPNKVLAEWIRDNLKFDQLILEFHYPEIPDSGWAHVSYKAKGNRNEVLTINRNGVFNGLL